MSGLPAVTAPAGTRGAIRLHLGDCLDVLRAMPANSVDAVVTDPPYGLGFMGKAWDCSVPGAEFAAEALRVIKPGGHIVAFAATRTVHRLAVALEDAGWEIRDTIAWLQWQGFPKSLDVSKAIDAARHDGDEVRVVCRFLRAAMERAGLTSKDVAGSFGVHSRMVDHWAARDTDSQPTLPTPEQWEQLRGLLGFGPEADDEVARLNARKGTWGNERADRETAPVVRLYGAGRDVVNGGTPATPEAARWSGWGTALKPAHEPAILARKPLDGTVAANVLRWGTGALNIDGCRYPHGDAAWPGPQDGESVDRFPANVYATPKASRSERETGCDHLPARAGHEAVEREEGSAGTLSPRAGAGRTAEHVRNHYPTVKPVALMRWLCRLVTPPGGTVIDPFLGSGTTGVAAVLEGFGFIGCEREAEYLRIALARIEHAAPGRKIEAPDECRVERVGDLFAWGAK